MVVFKLGIRLFSIFNGLLDFQNAHTKEITPSLNKLSINLNGRSVLNKFDCPLRWVGTPSWDPNTFMKFYLAGIWLGFIYPGTAYKPT